MLTDRRGQPVSHLDEYAPVTFDGCTYPQTVRSTKCEVLVSYGKCDACKTYLSTLRVLFNCYKARNTESVSDSSSHSNYRYLSTPEKSQRLTKLRKRARIAEAKLTRLKQRIGQCVQTCGQTLDNKVHDRCDEGQYSQYRASLSGRNIC